VWLLDGGHIILEPGRNGSNAETKRFRIIVYYFEAGTLLKVAAHCNWRTSSVVASQQKRNPEVTVRFY